MKQFNWTLLGVIFVALPVWGVSDPKTPTPFNMNAKSALVVNAETNEVILGKNADEIRPIASITKLMTAIVTLDAQLPLDESLVITHADVEATMIRGRPSSTSLPVGTNLLRSEILHLALMNSQNRAAASLARTYPGGTPAFVQAMNAKAVVLGMTNTHFIDPTGLMSLNVSTARDLAILAKHASAYEIIQRMSTASHLEAHVSTKHHQGATQFGTTNRLLKTPNWDIDVQKTGYISAAGRCLLMVVNVTDIPFIIVLLNTSSPYHRAADAIKIKNWIETGRVATRAQVAKLNPYKVTSKRTRKAKKHTSHR